MFTPMMNCWGRARSVGNPAGDSTRAHENGIGGRRFPHFDNRRQRKQDETND